MNNNEITVNCTIEKSINSGLYIAKVNGHIIGDFGLKFFAKRAIRKYIKNTFSDKVVVWERTVTLK